MTTSTHPAGTATTAAPHVPTEYYRFKPYNVSRFVLWGLFALVLAAAPKLFTSSLSLTILSQFGTVIIVCLSYNLLLGQGGMLSFGHAVYTGLGSFFAVHAMNLASSGAVNVPLTAVPLVGGMAGLLVAFVLGYPSTKKAGTPFAMITLGVGELVLAMALMFPEFFGGEGGITTNRVYGDKLLGWTFGPQIQVYYLIAIYCFVCTAAMFAFTRTPLGRMLNAVRDNPERVEYIGYSTQRIRYLAFMISGFFAGIAGGLAAINFEIVTAETVSGVRSGGYLLFTFLGGATFFFGPIIGAVMLVFAFVLLSELTKAWALYLGLAFVLMVMFAPGGVASLLMMNLRVAAFGKLRRLWTAYLALGALGISLLLAFSAMVEMVFKLRESSGAGTTLKFVAFQIDAMGVESWFGAGFVLVASAFLFEIARRHFVRDWGDTQAEIAKEIKRREGL